MRWRIDSIIEGCSFFCYVKSGLGIELIATLEITLAPSDLNDPRMHVPINDADLLEPSLVSTPDVLKNRLVPILNIAHVIFPFLDFFFS